MRLRNIHEDIYDTIDPDDGDEEYEDEYGDEDGEVIGNVQVGEHELAVWLLPDGTHYVTCEMIERYDLETMLVHYPEDVIAMGKALRDEGVELDCSSMASLATSIEEYAIDCVGR